MKGISKERYVMLYPSYFDSKLSRKMGRRVPKNLAIESPSLMKIEEACRKLGLKTIVESDKTYPRISNLKFGRIIVLSSGFKKSVLLKEIVRVMKVARG